MGERSERHHVLRLGHERGFARCAWTPLRGEVRCSRLDSSNVTRGVPGADPRRRVSRHVSLEDGCDVSLVQPGLLPSSC